MLRTIRKRVTNLEKAKGVGTSPLIIILRGIGQTLTAQELAALDDYQEKVTTETKEGFIVIFRTREKAQELLTLAEITKI